MRKKIRVNNDWKNDIWDSILAKILKTVPSKWIPENLTRGNMTQNMTSEWRVDGIQKTFHLLYIKIGPYIVSIVLHSFKITINHVKKKMTKKIGSNGVIYSFI